MAKKEDNRDVFDKALDYAPEVAGAVVGGALLRRSARSSRSKSLAQMEKELSPDEWRKFQAARKKYNAKGREAISDNITTGIGAISGGALGGMADGIAKRESNRRRK